MFPISDVEKSKRFPFITIALIAANIFVFYLQLTALDPEGFILKYALIPAKIDFSDYTTLYPFVTSMFLHGGFLHIISNMIFLWVFGDNVEGFFPPFTYLFFYLASGIFGSLAQYLSSPDSTIPMLGASGAVAGTLGAYFILFPNHTIKSLVLIPPFFVTTVNIPAAVMLGYWIILQIIAYSGTIGENIQQGGIAYLAHIGGFSFGILYVLLFSRKEV